MTTPRILAVVGAALAAQTTAPRFLDAAANVDLPLVAVVFAGLTGGPVVGLWTGTAGGLAQDLLSGGVLGVNGLAKSLIGTWAGWMSVQFITFQAWRRAVIVGAATLANAACVVGVYALVSTPGPSAHLRGVAMQGSANASVGIVATAVARWAPVMQTRRRGRRGRARFHRRTR
ncbi:MAG: rod shape-determining protein MreD [Acidobacteria bacterium]|nr:rod shape-determining protein MreD [Acidobacteriota bacterium]